jgi:N-acetylmuramic acid 6-phosphate etherase
MSRKGWAGLPTEAQHPEAGELDRMPPQSVLDLMAREDRRVVEAVHAEAPRIARAASLFAKALDSGGRVFLVGAGTSGRLGVLEAAECPPTFGTDPDRIVALMAGGRGAVFRSVEGAEDRDEAAVALLRARKVGGRDLVIGISASSVTPFVRAAVSFARLRRAKTLLVTCGPRVRGVADVVVALRVGPEVLAGSTRLKAATATKLVLNQVTLLAMIRLKKVYRAFMVDVRPRSKKLVDRAVRMVQSIACVDRDRAAILLARAGNDVKVAVVMGKLGVSRAEARLSLARKRGDLRRVLKSEPSRGRGSPRLGRARL